MIIGIILFVGGIMQMGDTSFGSDRFVGTIIVAGIGAFLYYISTKISVKKNSKNHANLKKN